jgi:dihydroxyacetone kinase DhaKLM complex PTS-EIIA-like component DhaM
VAFARNDLEKLIDTFTPILYAENMEWFIFETSRRLLEEIFERSSEGKNPSQSDEKAISNLLEKLKNLARTKGLNSDVVANREQLSVYKCLILIEVMNSVAPSIDFSVIRHNFDFFPNIKDFMGEKWLRKMEREKNRTHPLLVFSTDPIIDPQILERKTKEVMALEGTARKIEALKVADSMRTRALLTHLENEICSIKGSPSLRSIKAGLREEQQFWKVFSEIDALSRLSQQFTLRIGPPLEIQEDDEIRIKHPDFSLTLDGNDIYIEVISPEMFPPLRYFHNAGIPNRVRGKITDEIKHHFEGMKTPQDVLIIVDLASSELRYESIQDYVQGEMQFVFRMNVVTHDTEGVFTQRGEPMTKKDEQTKIIVGIIGYARVVGTDGKIHLRGRKFLNPQSENKSKVLDSVTKALLG